jgi:hypothetical protein
MHVIVLCSTSSLRASYSVDWRMLAGVAVYSLHRVDVILHGRVVLRYARATRADLGSLFAEMVEAGSLAGLTRVDQLYTVRAFPLERSVFL